MNDITIYPTEGCYQRPLESKFVRQTDTLVVVRPEGQYYDWKFSKKDGLRTGHHKNEFPRWTISLSNIFVPT